MGILEIHFHDSEFNWGLTSGEGGTLPLGIGSEETTEATESDSGSPSVLPKLGSFAVMLLVVGAGVAYNRMKRAREREEAEQEGRRLSLSRS